MPPPSSSSSSSTPQVPPPSTRVPSRRIRKRTVRARICNQVPIDVDALPSTIIVDDSPIDVDALPDYDYSAIFADTPPVVLNELPIDVDALPDDPDDGNGNNGNDNGSNENDNNNGSNVSVNNGEHLLACFGLEPSFIRAPPSDAVHNPFLYQDAKEIPYEYVLLLLTGPSSSSNRCTGEENGSFKMAVVHRLQRMQSTVHLSPTINPIEIMTKCMLSTNITNSLDFTTYMTDFIYIYGVTQDLKIVAKNKAYANYESRVKSFQKCKKSLLQEVPALCESGLFYSGDGYDDLMSCYCCDTYFMQWQYIVNPWVQHAIRSPDCTHLLLHKGREFVDEVHETYNYIKTCSIWNYQELFYDLFSLFDLGFMDSSLGYGDAEGRIVVIDQMVSAKMLRSAPQSLPLTSIDLNRPPLPNDVTCKICYREKIDVLFIPCGHLFACIQCAVTLHECAICREPFSLTTYAFRVTMEEMKYDEDDQSTTANSRNDNSIALCRVCKIHSIGAAFVPCLHVHSCYLCAITAEICPVCSLAFSGLIQVFV